MTQQQLPGKAVEQIAKMFDYVISLWKDDSNEMNGLHTLETLKSDVLSFLNTPAPPVTGLREDGKDNGCYLENKIQVYDEGDCIYRCGKCRRGVGVLNHFNTKDPDATCAALQHQTQSPVTGFHDPNLFAGISIHDHSQSPVEDREVDELIQSAKDKAEELTNKRAEIDGYYNPAYYDGVKNGYLAALSSLIPQSPAQTKNKDL